jgi:hypothetical protein
MRNWGIVLFFLPLSLFAQNHDNTWIMGGSSVNGIFDGFQWGTMIVEFDHDPFMVRYDSAITLDRTSSIISDQDGKLLMYSNGQSVHNAFHRPVPMLDTISYSTYWENFNYPNYLPNGGNWISGFPIRKGVMMLPSFTPNEYIVFSIRRIDLPDDNVDAHRTTSLMSTEVRFDNATPQGKVIYKERLLSDGFFQGGFSACRHANGRDWWIVHNAEYNAALYVFLYTPDGINLINTFTDVTKVNERQTFVVGNFSRDGSLYVTAEQTGDLEKILHLTIYDFDRRTGTLNRKEYKTIFPQLILYGSVEFSHSGKYLYIANGQHVFQYDITKNEILPTEKIVATYDGSVFAYVEGGPATNLFFSSMTLGPDGRIYCIPPGGVRSMHVIDYPDEAGEAATVIQNKFKLPCQIFNSIPSFPNYRLGPLDGSACDTLGLDNHPIAKYRYEPDTMDYKRIRFTDLSYFRPETWSWDFGDGSPNVTKQNPPFHTFAQNGTYKVCLTVSNENSSNTSCRNITIGTSATDDDLSTIADVTLFPNPVQDNLLVTIGEYIPERGYIEIYNLSGQQIHKQRAYYGHNNVDMSAMVSGTYVLRITDGDVLIKEEKVVKM